jgi:hypothetical protein
MHGQKSRKKCGTFLRKISAADEEVKKGSQGQQTSTSLVLINEVGKQEKEMPKH